MQLSSSTPEDTEDNSMSEDSECLVLKFKALREKLDWKGNVVEETDTYDFKWERYDPQAFLESVIRKGDLSCVPPLTPIRYAHDFMRHLDPEFGRNDDYDAAIKRYKLIESEPFSGIKYVVYDRASDNEMKWVME